MSGGVTIDSLDWERFWALATPEQAACGLLALYGDGAGAAASASAVAARNDGLTVDAEFWDATRAVLHRHAPVRVASAATNPARPRSPECS